jgi:3-methyladenine DNA glycosylase AlkD
MYKTFASTKIMNMLYEDWTKDPNDNLFWLERWISVCWLLGSLDKVPDYPFEDFLE